MTYEEAKAIVGQFEKQYKYPRPHLTPEQRKWYDEAYSKVMHTHMDLDVMLNMYVDERGYIGPKGKYWFVDHAFPMSSGYTFLYLRDNKGTKKTFSVINGDKEIKQVYFSARVPGEVIHMCGRLSELQDDFRRNKKDDQFKKEAIDKHKHCCGVCRDLEPKSNATSIKSTETNNKIDIKPQQTDVNLKKTQETFTYKDSKDTQIPLWTEDRND